MDSSVKRVYVEKKAPYAAAAKELKEEIEGYLGIRSVRNVRILIRYDVENLPEEVFRKALRLILPEPPVDDLYEEESSIPKDARVFSVE